MNVIGYDSGSRVFLVSWDEEIYRALVHPIRRCIIEGLQERDELSFDELLKYLGTGNHGKLGFHLRALKGLIEHRPSAMKYRLTDMGRLAGELAWDTRFMIARHGVDLEHEPKRYCRRLRLGDHAVLFHETEDEKREKTFPYLLAGLLKGEAVVYAVSENRLDSESLEIQRFGIRIDYLPKGAFTIMSADEWYLRKGKAQADTIMANWLTFFKEKQKAGFTELRGAAEMEVFFNYAISKELLSYEATLGRQLPSNVCALCLYDMQRLDEEQFIQLNKSHGHSIFKGIAVKTI